MMVSAVTVLGRIAQHVPERELRILLTKIADRLDELKAQELGAQLEIHIRVSRGFIYECRWDPDEYLKIHVEKPPKK